MTKIYRTEPIQIENETINLEYRPIKDIFKDDDAPYLAVGVTQGGKTTFCIDIIHKFAEKVAKIYYVSSTKPMIGEGAIDTIPNVFKMEPTFENIYGIWKEIKEGAEEMSIPTNEMLRLISSIYPPNESKTVITSYNEQMRNLDIELKTKYKNMPPEKLNQVIANERDIVSVEVLSRLILSGVNLYGTAKLNRKQINAIRTLLSTEQKTILLIDDVTAEINKLQNSTDTVMFGTDGQETPTKKSRAISLLFTDMFTKARRYDVILILFVHTWDTIKFKQQLKNFIIVDRQSAEGIKSLRTVGTTRTKSLINIASNKIFGNYPYHVIVVKGDDICVTKADINVGNELKLDPLNQHLVDAYNKIKLGMEYTADDSNENEDEVDTNIRGLID